MDAQATPFALSFLLLGLLLICLPQFSTATLPNNIIGKDSQQESSGKDQEPPNTSATQSEPSVFPNTLDISSLQKMPLIILHPRNPINFQMMPGETLESIHKSLSPNKILELIQSATGPAPFNVPAPNSNQGDRENKEARSRNLGHRQQQASGNRPVSSQSDYHADTPALPRSFLNPQSNNGWFQRFRGSFSNVLPMMKPSKDNPFNLGLPSFNLPVFFPQHNPIQATISPYALNSLQQLQNLPWRQMNFHTPSIVPLGDLSVEASHLNPLRTMFNSPFWNRFRPASFPQLPFNGDLATSGSAFIPRRIPPPGYHGFNRFVPFAPRHKPLFNNVGGLQAASMEISNAFADFTDAKEHGPEVTQKFGSVGHSINNFLKMMGLGSGLSFGDGGGFGGGADMAGMESTPIARSLDFYPGYGNQAHWDDFNNLDDIEDFPMFHEDITDDFMRKMNLTNSTASEEKKKDKEVPKKDTTLPKMSMESGEKIKVPLIKASKDKDTTNKATEGMDILYAPATPLDKTQGKNETQVDKTQEKHGEHPVVTYKVPTQVDKTQGKHSEHPVVTYKVPTQVDKTQGKHIERPVVNYKVPTIHSTVPPHDRKQPIAIYQHFKSINKEAPKPPTYAPAQAMPQQEGEKNPNKLVDEDVVRQWRLVNNGQGYVEKRPVPIVDILQTSMHPESLKVLQKVLSDTAKTKESSSSP